MENELYVIELEKPYSVGNDVYHIDVFLEKSFRNSSYR